MKVWVIETIEDHAAGDVLGVTATAALAVAFLRERFENDLYGKLTDPEWHEPRVGERAGAVHVTPVDDLPAEVDHFTIYRGEGWRLLIWAVTRFDVIE